MAVTIDSTVGGASANSFVLLTEAQTYMDARLNESAWESATTDSKNRALVEATRELSARNDWCGRRASDTQALAWPRDWAINPDDPNLSYFSSSTIPQRVKDATCELAHQFIKAGTTDISELPSTDGVIEKTVDVLTTVYAEPYQRKTGLRRYPTVWRFIAPLLEASGFSVPVERG